MGITTGKVTGFHYGSRVAEPARVGDCINQGFRLSGMVNKERSGKIILCFNTAALVQHDCLLKDLGKVSVKAHKRGERVFVSKESRDDFCWKFLLNAPAGFIHTRKHL
jgi:class 3 adenylate cyclase